MQGYSLHMAGLVLLILAFSTWASPSFAQGTSAQQTAVAVHATDERANCLAQGRCAADTSTPTPTAIPTATATPTSPPATPSPSPTAAAADPPALPLPPPGGDPVSGYLRPRADGLYELALHEGRWTIALADNCAISLAPWSNVWLLLTVNRKPMLAPAEYFAELDNTLLCPLTGAAWDSNAPCDLNDASQCDVVADASFQDALSQQDVADAQQPVAPTTEPTPRVITRSVPAPAPPPVQVVYQPAPTQEPQVITVYSTVLVYVPTSTPRPATPAPTRTPETFSPTPTPTLEPTVVAEPTPEPAAATTSPPGFGIWGVLLGGAAVVATIAMRGKNNGGDSA